LRCLKRNSCPRFAVSFYFQFHTREFSASVQRHPEYFGRLTKPQRKHPSTAGRKYSVKQLQTHPMHCAAARSRLNSINFPPLFLKTESARQYKSEDSPSVFCPSEHIPRSLGGIPGNRPPDIPPRRISFHTIFA
jgi:hypothetical protein